MKYIIVALAILGIVGVSATEFANYESFGAVGDGKTDDLVAIVVAR